MTIHFWLCSILMSLTLLLSNSAKAQGLTASLGVMDPRFKSNLDPLTEIRDNSGLDPLFIAWTTDFSEPFPKDQCNRVWRANRIPLIIWDPLFPTESSRHPVTIKLKDIVDGEYDSYLISWASEAASFDRPVLIQFLREFNISSHPWSIESNQKSAALARRAFQKVVTVFRSSRAKNVRWVWGPSVFPSTAAAWNDWEDAYPGNPYVDYIGLAGLDYGGTKTSWMPLSFEQLFEQPVRRIRRLADDKPILITATSTLQMGADRQQWIREMASQLLGPLSNIRGVIWFNQDSNWSLQAGDSESFRALPKQTVNEEYRKSFLDRPFWTLRILPFKKDVNFSPQVLKIPFINETNLSKLSSALGSAPSLYMDFPFLSIVGHALGKDEKFMAKVRLAWNMSGLLVWSEVNDTSLGESKMNPEEIWDGDNLELGIGIPQYTDRPVSFQHCFRLLISPGGPHQISPSYALFRGSDGGLETDTHGIKFRSQFGVGDNSYRLFGIVPWTALGIVPAMGNVVPFNVAVTDGSKGHRVRQLIWAGTSHYYHDSSEWGQLVLLPP